MTNRVLVTGTALGIESGACQQCSFDYSWLLHNPSVLLWADEVLVTRGIWDLISSGHVDAKNPEMADSIQLIFQIADSHGVIKFIDSESVITEEVADSIYAQIDRDREMMLSVYPDSIQEGDTEAVPGELYINGLEYCLPYVFTVYAGFVLASAFNAQYLFDPRVYNYVRHKFGLERANEIQFPTEPISFSTVYNSIWPNHPIVPFYATHKDYSKEQSCFDCSREMKCRTGYLSWVEGAVEGLLTYRDRDEIQQMKLEIDHIIAARDSAGGSLNASDVLVAFDERQRVLRRRLYNTFPKIERWTNLATIISAPLGLHGVFTADPVTIGASASLFTASKATREAVKWLASKYNWVSFIPSQGKRVNTQVDR